MVEKSPPWTALTALASLPLILLTWYWRTVHRKLDLRNAEEGQITERFTRAVEQLGSDRMAVRLGGIYALERISKDSARDHSTVVEVLSAYVREATRSGAQRDVQATPATDVAAALSVLGRRRRDLAAEATVDLAGAYLNGAELDNLDFCGASFSRAFLSVSRFRQASLRRTSFDRAVMTGSNLAFADLDGASFFEASLGNASFQGAKLELAGFFCASADKAMFYGAKLTKANLIRGRFEGASFSSADLSGAILGSADFSNAMFQGAKLENVDLGRVTLTNAEYDDKTVFPPGFDPVAAGMVKVRYDQEKHDWVPES
jgi:uncharacterized protein YjbI with pentapeptide repeats